MAPSVPTSLKKIKVFLARAEELDRDAARNPESRVVAYNLRQYAVQVGISLANDAESKKCLGDILSELEKEKAPMSVFNNAEHWKICRKMADKVFDKADSEDRGGVANKGTAKSFYAAGTFYEICQQFYKKSVDEETDETLEMREEEEQRRLYCKWKATEILNAIKEGRTPTPGGYQQEEEEEETGDGGMEVETPQSDEYGLPLSPSVTNDSGGLPSIREASREDVLPPAPSIPSSDLYNTNTEENNTNVNGGVELNLDGQPTVEEVNEGDEDSGSEDIFIPAAAKQAADDITKKNSVFDYPLSPPPPYSDIAATSETPDLPPPAASKPLPPPTPPSPSKSSGVFGGLFGGGKSSSTKLSKDLLADAVEITTFAISALKHGDSDLGRERLELALGLWKR